MAFLACGIAVVDVERGYISEPSIDVGLAQASVKWCRIGENSTCITRATRRYGAGCVIGSSDGHFGIPRENLAAQDRQ